MRSGEFEDGTHVLRARIDMAAPNMKMRDPLLYRIRHATHYRTGDEWCIYPMYDWAHPLSDAIEGITHSLCTLEFSDNRALYDWVVDNTRPDIESGEPGAWRPRPRQTEFARLNLDYTVMSKRKLAELVSEGRVDGWDDPRMPTLAGLRRRGVRPEAIRRFCHLIGVAKADNRVDIGKLEHAIRDDLNRTAPRVMCVLRPLRVEIENYPEGKTEELEAPYFPSDLGVEGSRKVPFSRDLLIERTDFEQDPPKGFYRLAPGQEVRLRYAYLITCNDVVMDPETGEVVKLRCTYDPETRGGSAPDGRKVRGTIQWVSCEESLPCEVRLYDRLFSEPNPEEAGDFKAYLNPESLAVQGGGRIEPSVAEDPVGTHYQFERLGYFIRDPDGLEEGRLVYNRTVPLPDTWGSRAADGTIARDQADGAIAGDRADAGAIRPEEGEGGVDRGRQVRDELRARRPELAARFERYVSELGLPEEDADLLSGDVAVAEFFEGGLAVHDSPQGVANWIVNELLRELKDRKIENLPFGGEEIGRLVALVEAGTISGRTAKDVFARLVREGGDPREIVRAGGVEQISDPAALRAIVEGAIDGHPEQAARYRAGQSGLLGFFVGQVMRETGGRANPEVVQRLVREKLG